MIKNTLPCMIFSPSAQISDEVGVLSSAHDILTLDDLGRRFLRSLYDDADSFRRLCASEETDEYRIYKIKSISRVRQFEFAFCEKCSFLGENLTAVYLAHSISSFRPLMAPSSGLLRTSADKAIYELLSISDHALPKPPVLSSEAFSVFERIPSLCEAIFDERVKSQYCDVLKLTHHVVDKLKENPALSAQLSVKEKHGILSSASGDGKTGEKADEPLIELSVDAYVAVMSVVVGIAASVSCSHKIDVTVSFYSYAADIILTTETSKLAHSVRLASLGYLSDHVTRSDLLRIAEVIAYIAGIDLSFSFDETSGEIKFVIGLGYEMQTIPDFKFSDPFSIVPVIIDEMNALAASL